MRSNVLDYEPGLALFVPDDDPLRFYRAIARSGLDWLKPGGYLLFEINEALGEEMLSLVTELGYEQATIRQDLQGKDRMLRTQKPLQKTRGHRS